MCSLREEDRLVLRRHSPHAKGDQIQLPLAELITKQELSSIKQVHVHSSIETLLKVT